MLYLLSALRGVSLHFHYLSPYLLLRERNTELVAPQISYSLHLYLLTLLFRQSKAM